MTTEKDQIPDAEIIDTTAVDVTDLPPTPAAQPAAEGIDEEVDAVAAIMMVATASVQLSGSLPENTTPEAFNAMLERLVVSYATNVQMLETFEQISDQVKAHVRREVMKELEVRIFDLRTRKDAGSALGELLSFTQNDLCAPLPEAPRLVIRRVRP